MVKKVYSLEMIQSLHPVILCLPTLCPLNVFAGVLQCIMVNSNTVHYVLYDLNWYTVTHLCMHVLVCLYLCMHVCVCAWVCIGIYTCTCMPDYVTLIK